MASYLYPCHRCSLIVRFARPQEFGTRITCDQCEKDLAENARLAAEAEAEHLRQVNAQKGRAAPPPPKKVSAKK